MANDDNPRGLIPLDYPMSSVHAYRITTGGDVFIGQAVDAVAAGYISAITMTGLQPTIGVVVGFLGPFGAGLATNDPFLDVSDITPPTGGLSSGDRYALVLDDPQQQYLIQEDTGGTALTLAEVWSNFDLVFRGPTGTVTNGNTDTGWANLELDASAIVQTSAGFAQVIRLHESVNSDGTRNAVGDFAKWVVRLSQHRLATTPLPNIAV